MLSNLEARVSCSMMIVADSLFEVYERTLMVAQAFVQHALRVPDIAKTVEDAASSFERSVLA